MSIDAMKMFLAMGEMTNQNETREDKLKYQERIVFATMRANIPEWEPPTNWYELPLEDREKRLKQLKQLNN
tara:strand:+ start:512 stop:724 length:213 start_codon:yes stop_codon:yes gene_type:complete